jgi:hypothetical protein
MAPPSTIDIIERHRAVRTDTALRERRVDAMVRHDVLSADLLLINGRVLTMDAHDSVAQAVAEQSTGWKHTCRR